MCPTRISKCIGTLLVAATCLLSSAAPAMAAQPNLNSKSATTPLKKHMKKPIRPAQPPRIVFKSPSNAGAPVNRGKQALRVKASPQLPKIGNKLPQSHGYSPRKLGPLRFPTSTKLAVKKQAPRSGSFAAVKPEVNARPGGALDLAHKHVAINPAQLRARLEGRMRGELTEVNRQRVTEKVTADVAKGAAPRQGAGNLSSTSNGSALGNIAARAGNVKSRVAEDALGANSSTLRALEKAMPGFRERGGKGATRLRDLGASGNHRNPVTSGGSFSDFAGGGSDQVSKGGKSKVEHVADGVTRITDKKGTVTTIYDDHGIIVTKHKDGRTEIQTDDYTAYYDKKGNYTGKVDSKGNTEVPIEPINSQGGKQASQKEPTPDGGESNSSGPKYITGADLRGLAARLEARGEPTGDEATSGGPVDKSKTRQGRIDQVGQPTDESPTVQTVPDVKSMEFKQALRVRLRNVTPIPR